jgi:WD40 repeat protein
MSLDDGYDAFISYRRQADAPLARHLQPALERFATPWYRPRRLRIFRDDSSLSANSDLRASVENALVRSRWFVLLACPEAAESTWIDWEVKRWLELHDGSTEQILIGVTAAAAEPGTSVDWLDGLVPPRLRDGLTTEPRWVDLRQLRRSDKGGRRQQRRKYRNLLHDAAAEFASAIIGRPKDELHGEVRRQYRATMRLAVGVILALSVLLVTATASAFVAVAQQRRAEEQAMIATSRQLVADAKALTTTDPGLARQLIAIAYRIYPTAQAITALLESPGIPGVLEFASLVRDVAYGGDGAWIAVATDEGVYLRDADDGKQLALLTGFDGYAGSVAVSPDWRTLAAGGSDGSVRLWDVGQPTAPRLLDVGWGTGRLILDLEFRAAGDVLASVENGLTVRLFDVSNPNDTTAVTTIEGAHTVGEPAIGFSPDGAVLAVADEDNGVRLWDIDDVRKPRLMSRLIGHSGPVTAVSFSPDGMLVASGSRDQTVRLWNVADPSAPVSRPTLVGHTGNVEALDFSDDGQYLASGDWDGVVKVWALSDTARPSLRTTLERHGDFVNAVTFRPGAQTLASGGSDGAVRLWDLSNAGGSAALSTIDTARGPLAINSAGTLLAAGPRVELWDLTQPSAPVPLQPLLTSGDTHELDFHPNGRLLAVALGEAGAQLFDLTDATSPRAVARIYLAGGSLDTLAFSPDGRALITGGVGHNVTLWDLSDSANPRDPYNLGDALDAVQTFAFTAEGTVASIWQQHELSVWNVAQRTRPSLMAVIPADPDEVRAVGFTTDGSAVLTVEGRGGLVRYPLTDGAEPTAEPVATGQIEPPGTAAFSPDGQLMATSAERTVRLWAVSEAGAVAPTATLTTGSSLIDNLVISADGSLLISADSDGGVQLWSLDLDDLRHRICVNSGDPISRAEWVQYVGVIDYDPPCAG